MRLAALGIALIVALPVEAATVLSVGDGDTITFKEGAQKTQVRLACIDAPGTSQGSEGWWIPMEGPHRLQWREGAPWRRHPSEGGAGDIQFLCWSVVSDPRRFGHYWNQCCPLFLRSFDL